jgi:hypothetical protein
VPGACVLDEFHHPDGHNQEGGRVITQRRHTGVRCSEAYLKLMGVASPAGVSPPCASSSAHPQQRPRPLDQTTLLIADIRRTLADSSRFEVLHSTINGQHQHQQPSRQGAVGHHPIFFSALRPPPSLGSGRGGSASAGRSAQQGSRGAQASTRRGADSGRGAGSSSGSGSSSSSSNGRAHTSTTTGRSGSSGGGAGGRLPGGIVGTGRTTGRSTPSVMQASDGEHYHSSV